MIPMRDLDDDYYDFDERNFCLVGRRRHHKYQLGDAVKIKVANANIEKKQLDFVLVDNDRPKTSDEGEDNRKYSKKSNKKNRKK